MDELTPLEIKEILDSMTEEEVLKLRAKARKILKENKEKSNGQIPIL